MRLIRSKEVNGYEYRLVNGGATYRIEKLSSGQWKTLHFGSDLNIIMIKYNLI